MTRHLSCPMQQIDRLPISSGEVVSSARIYSRAFLPRNTADPTRPSKTRGAACGGPGCLWNYRRASNNKTASRYPARKCAAAQQNNKLTNNTPKIILHEAHCCRTVHGTDRQFCGRFGATWHCPQQHHSYQAILHCGTCKRPSRQRESVLHSCSNYLS